MKSNSALFFGTFLFFLLISCVGLIPGIYGVINHETMLIKNHGELIVPTKMHFFPEIWVGSLAVIILGILIFKYRRVEMNENGITILRLLKKGVHIPWNEVQYLRRIKWPLPEKIVFKVKALNKSAFYFRTDYSNPIWTRIKEKVDPTEMEKFIAAKKKEYNIKSSPRNRK
jgi:hypothetical protein